MSRRNAKHKRPFTPHQKYPVQAIRDFFEQLLWELRCSHYETYLSESEVKPELLARLDPYIRKYGTVLLPWIDLDAGNLSEEQRKRLVEKVNLEIRKTRDEQLLHLEAIRPLLGEALQQANGPPRLLLFRIGQRNEPAVSPTSERQN